MVRPDLLLKALLFYKINKHRKRRQRSVYVRPIFRQRYRHGEGFLVHELGLDPEYHHKYFRMSKENFQIILAKVTSDIEHDQNHILPISPTDRLAITLRYLATGNSQISMAINYRMSPSSVSKIIRETLTAICKRIGPEYLKVPTKSDWKIIATEFERKWNYPLCCGAIDGKHVRIRCPGQTGSEFFNYKGYFSINLFAVADAHYKFTLVEIGNEGSASDAGIYPRSKISKFVENGEQLLPASENLLEDERFPYVFVGDDAFPLKPHLMKPYPGKFLSIEDRIFNYRLSRARMVVENSFGILAARWRIFHSTIDAKIDLVNLIVRSTVILHNFLIEQKDMGSITVDNETEQIRGNWRDVVSSDSGMVNISRQGSNNYSADAGKVRDRFRDYFLSEAGSVKWQHSYIMQGYQ